MPELSLPSELSGLPFSFRKAKKAGFTQYDLQKLLDAKKIERIGNGIYAASDCDLGSMEARFTMATLRCQMPSTICLLSALEYHNLTDIIPKQTWILVPDSKRIRGEDLKLIRSRNPNWNMGIEKEKKYWITSIERTIIDCFIYSRHVGQNTATEALKRAINKKVKPKDIIDLSNKLKVKHRIMSYVEMVS